MRVRLRVPKDRVPSMSQAQSFSERHAALTWWFVIARIGQDLRERYEVPKDLPQQLQTLVMKMDARSDREQMAEARTVAGVKAFPDWFALT